MPALREKERVLIPILTACASISRAISETVMIWEMRSSTCCLVVSLELAFLNTVRLCITSSALKPSVGLESASSS